MNSPTFWLGLSCVLVFTIGFMYRFTWTECVIGSSVHLTLENTIAASKPEFDEELQTVLNMTEWSIVRIPSSFEFSTSPKTSSYILLQPRSTYIVGETLEVLITAKDHKGQPKRYGGDFFKAKLHSPSMKAGVSGSVKDYNNGTYTATFLLVWPGDTEISVKLMHSSEAISILHEKRDSRPDKIFFHGHFERNGIREVVECNVDLPGNNLCEYYDPGTGEKWVCFQPKNLPCDSYHEHSVGGKRDIFNDAEKQFLSM